LTGKLNSLQEEIVDTIGGYQLLRRQFDKQADKLKAMLKEEVEEKELKAEKAVLLKLRDKLNSLHGSDFFKEKLGKLKEDAEKRNREGSRGRSSKSQLAESLPGRREADRGPRQSRRRFAVDGSTGNPGPPSDGKGDAPRRAKGGQGRRDAASRRRRHSVRRGASPFRRSAAPDCRSSRPRRSAARCRGPRSASRRPGRFASCFLSSFPLNSSRFRFSASSLSLASSP